MIELAYRCNLDGHEEHVYTLKQYDTREPFAFMIDGVVIGKIDKVDGVWKQISGSATPEVVIADIGKFLDNRNG